MLLKYDLNIVMFSFLESLSAFGRNTGFERIFELWLKFHFTIFYTDNDFLNVYSSCLDTEIRMYIFYKLKPQCFLWSKLHYFE